MALWFHGPSIFFFIFNNCKNSSLRFSMALDGFYFDQTERKVTELLAWAKKVFCYKKKSVGERREAGVNYFSKTEVQP
jgi:hypothetical protein